MKFLIAFTVLIVVAVAAPPRADDARSATIVSSSFDNIGTDGYKFDFTQSDGQSRQESAVIKNIDSENPANSVSGQAEWYDNGVKYTLKYYADETGFHAEGDHIPKV